MWPFKKKDKTPAVKAKVAKTILCIPGNWEDFDDFKDSLIASTEAEYLTVGDFLINGKRKRHYTFEFCERDEKMKASFAVAGKVTRVREDFLDEIENHKYVVYISGDTGNLEEAEHIVHAGNAILKAGGIGIKIETTGKAFEKSRWMELLVDFESHRLYEMFVLDSIIDEDGTVFSCGMQNIGLKDTIVSGEGFQDAVDLIKIFGYYQIVDKPVIHNNQTFQKSAGASIYRITDEPHPRYEGHETFENPFGMWRLTRVH